MILAILTLALAQSSNGAQHAIDLAEPGSTVELSGTGVVERLALTKPLTVVFGPNLTVRHLRLDGYGALTLVGLRLDTPQGGEPTESSLSGQGFTDLRFIDCSVRAYAWHLGAEYAELVNSTFMSFGVLYDYHYTLDLGGSPLVMLDSVVWQGGASQYFGLRCGPLLRTEGSFPGASPHLFQPEGVMQEDLLLTGNPRPGGTLTLAWDMPNQAVGLFAELGYRRPARLYSGSHGFAFLSPDATLVAWGGSTGSASLLVPPTLALSGERLTFQAFNPPGRFGRPQAVQIR